MFKQTSLLLLLAPMCASAARAQLLVPTFQERRIDVSVAVGVSAGLSDSEVALDFSPFSEFVSVQEQAPAQGLEATSATAQTSLIEPDGITVSANFNVEAIGFPSYAECNNTCSVSFTITEPVRYTLHGFVEAFDVASTVVFLTGGGGFQFQQLAGMFSQGNGFHQEGVMLPGDYSLLVALEGAVLDGFPVALGSGAAEFDMQFEAVSGADCVPTPNSTGNSAVLSAYGTPVASGLGFGLGVSGAPPGEFGLFLYGASQPPVPFGDGVLCLGQPLVRFPSINLIFTDGSVGQSVNFNSAPFAPGGPNSILPGSTWTFQFWFRDAPSASGWNMSNTAIVSFEP